MIVLPQNVLDALTDSASIIAPLAEIDWPAGKVFATNLAFDVIFNGDVYIGVGSYGGADVMTDSIDSIPSGFKLTLNGASAGNLAEVFTEYQNSDVTIHIVAIDGNNQVVGEVGVAHGLASKADISTSKDVAAISLDVVSEYHYFNIPRGLLYSTEDQEKLHTGDTFFRHIPLEDKEITF